MRCNPTRWAWGLIPIAMLSWTAFYRERAAIEADLAERTASAVGAVGQKWALVTLNGRDAVITGRAERDGQPKAALDAVRSVWGVRKVDLKTDIASAPERGPMIAVGPTAADPDAVAKRAAQKAAAEKARLEAEARAAEERRRAEAEAKARAEKEAADRAVAEKAAADARAAEEKARADAEAKALAERTQEQKVAAAEAEARAQAEKSAQDKARQDAEARAAAEKAAADKAAADKAAAEAQAAAQRAKEEAEARAKVAKAEVERKTTDATRACEGRLQEAARSGVILFERAKSDIAKESHLTLARLAEIAKSCPGMKIEVGGHTDAEGEPDRNQRLSERRASAVLKSLVRAGVPEDQLSAVGFGAEKPVAPNDSPENMARNRRIEFKVYSE